MAKKRYAIHLLMGNENALLPRVLLVFSRRRQHIERLSFSDGDSGAAARMRIDVRCELQQANEVARQLLRIVEVTEARVEDSADPVNLQEGELLVT